MPNRLTALPKRVLYSPDSSCIDFDIFFRNMKLPDEDRWTNAWKKQLNRMRQPEVKTALRMLYERQRTEAAYRERAFLQNFFCPEIDIYIIPGGKKPIRATPDAIGFDSCARSIVSGNKNRKDPINQNLRESLYLFKGGPETADESIRDHICRVPKENNPRATEWAYALWPGETTLIDLGFVTAMPFPMFYWVAPRSGHAFKQVTVANAPGTVDPGYRGAAGALLKNGGAKPFYIRRNMRIVQCIFCWAMMPLLKKTKNYKDLSESFRSGQGFGSTGSGYFVPKWAKLVTKN